MERDAREVLIVGAGNGGQQVAAELRRNPELRNVPIGFVDDDPRKQGDARRPASRCSAPPTSSARILDDAEPDEVVIAIPSALGHAAPEGRDRVPRARDPGPHAARPPSSCCRGGVNLMRQVREVQVEDVLGREPVRVEIDRVGAYLGGETVLVTGAGGSIGSELCRQIARVGPQRLVLVDNAENALFEIRRELEQERHFARLAAVLADCKDATRMREVFDEHRPSVVFHAAAYKHVPLMEENPVEAVRNNAVATRIVAAAAGEAGVKRFVLVSTDKAVSARHRDGRVQGARRVGGRGRPAPLARHPLLDGAVRQRARFVGLGRADLPPPDRRGRPGHRDRREDDPLLHDDPGGGAADHPLRRALRRAARCSCSRWATR